MEFAGLVRELWAMIRTRKSYWLTPIVAVLLLVALLIVVTGSSALAPFLYPLF